MKLANDVLAFALELAALAALVVWAWSVGDDLAVHVLLAVCAVVAFMAVWGRWLAPRSPHRLRPPSLPIVQLLAFAVAAVALGAAGHPVLAVLLAGLAAITVGFAARWGSALGAPAG